MLQERGAGEKPLLLPGTIPWLRRSLTPFVCWQREAAAAWRVQAAREVSLLGAESGILGQMELLQGFANWGSRWGFPGVACRGFLSRGWRVMELLLEMALGFWSQSRTSAK